MNLDELYSIRNDLLTMGAEWESEEVERIEFLISEIERLPEFEEVMMMIGDGRMKSIFNK